MRALLVFGVLLAGCSMDFTDAPACRTMCAPWSVFQFAKDHGCTCAEDRKQDGTKLVTSPKDTYKVPDFFWRDR
jgi:hypothetical protein